ncbi:MAG: glucose-1-phosphate thymidylyltransferase [Candidatus Aenigmatarchaeota archaeon]|nr:MAG: glucose-1-phosphate thymidylyltransferase [Candidatus Aenigmarchaeota archaeon]
MNAVILAAGKSTRTYPLTVNKPKSLLKVANKHVIKYNLDALKGLVKEVIIVVGFCKDMIKAELGNEYEGMKIIYAEQEEQLGTGHALLAAEPFVDERFFVMMGDDIYSKEDIRKLLMHRCAVSAKKVSDPSSFGIWIVENGLVRGYEEKPENPRSDLANPGLYVLTRDIFPHIRSLQKSPRGEYELNEAVNNLAKDIDIHCVEIEGWIPIGYPWDVLDANEKILESHKGIVKGLIEEGVVIKGEVSIGMNTLVKSGSYIEGPVIIGDNCVIGPNCHIRPKTSIGNDCHIEFGVQIKNSVIGDGVNIKHLSYIGDSVIGDNVNIACGTITANLRHDGNSVSSFVKGQKIDTKRRKFGTVIGEGAKTGIGTLIYPGRKIWPGKTTLPGEVVKDDIM